MGNVAGQDSLEGVDMTRGQWPNAAITAARRAVAVLVVAMSLLCGCSPGKGRVPFPGQASPSGQDRFKVLGPEDRLSSRELLGLLTAFVDSYMENILEAADTVLSDKNITPKNRAFFTGLKTYYVTAAINNVTHTSIEVGLLDMVAMVTLQRMLWAETASRAQFGQAASDKLLQKLTKLESAIWAIADRVLSPEQRRDLRLLIEQWRQDNPNVEYVAFIRFQDFAPSRMKEALDEVVRGGGLLAPLSDASHELHETRMLAERSMIWLKRLPMLLQLHGTLLGFDALSLPETRKALGELDRFVAAAGGIQRAVEQLPQSARTVRQEALADLETKLTAQQQLFFGQLREFVERERTLLLSGLGNQGESVGKTVADAQLATRNLLLTAEALERMLGPANPGKPGDANATDAFAANLRLISQTAQTLTALTASLDALAGKAESRQAGDVLRQLDDLLAAHERRLFLYLTTAMALGFVFTLGVVWFARRQR